MKSMLLASILFAFSMPVFAQSVEVNDSNEAPTQVQPGPETGKDKASGYFKARKGGTARTAATEGGPAPRFLAIHVGTFFSGQSYKWGEFDQKNAGKLNAGVTYRIGEWVNSMDLSIRLEYTNYSFPDNVQDSGSARKLSISPIVTFPDANSKFPLYFGGGVGLGLFIEQLHDKSPVALDWQVLAGVRFMDVFENMGFMVETGLKNHVLLASEGQFNGVFINVGTVFDF